MARSAFARSAKQKRQREELETHMIIEDLQHRYDQLRVRTARVRSYL
jgi:hypothetical protein